MRRSKALTVGCSYKGFDDVLYRSMWVKQVFGISTRVRYLGGSYCLALLCV